MEVWLIEDGNLVGEKTGGICRSVELLVGQVSSSSKKTKIKPQLFLDIFFVVGSKCNFSFFFFFFFFFF